MADGVTVTVACGREIPSVRPCDPIGPGVVSWSASVWCTPAYASVTGPRKTPSLKAAVWVCCGKSVSGVPLSRFTPVATVAAEPAVPVGVGNESVSVTSVRSQGFAPLLLPTRGRT